MENNIIFEGIKDATESINNNADFLIDHATDQLFYLDELLKGMERACIVLVRETYSNILLLEFETILLSKAIKYNKPAIKINDSTLNVIKLNCDDLLEKIKKIKELQEERTEFISYDVLKKVADNKADVELGRF